MATIWSNAGGSITSNPPDIAKAIRQIERAVKVGARKGAELSLYAIREQVQRGLQSNSLGLNPIKDSTRQTRLAGKTGGRFPARPRVTGTRPLWATGGTARAIKININNDVFIMGFDDGLKYTYNSREIGKTAKQQEDGYTIHGVYTKRMLAYMHILFKRKSKKDRNDLGGKVKVGMAYTRKVDARPAWEKVMQKMQPMVINTIAFHVVDQIKKTGLQVETS
jgi:hypothetical protein